MVRDFQSRLFVSALKLFGPSLKIRGPAVSSEQNLFA